MDILKGWFQIGCLSLGLLMGCAGSENNAVETKETGTAALPLVTHGPSGAKYRLRNANFQIVPYQYYYGYGTSVGVGGAMPTTGGTGAVGTTPNPTIVASSEDNPDSDSIDVTLESGQYYIQLLSGWWLEKDENGQSTPVEAQLLSGGTQWIWVSPHSTSWVQYQLGIGDRALWFNGNINVQLNVYEDPSQYYGGGGSTSYGGASAVYTSTGTAGAAGTPLVATTRYLSAGGSTGF